MVIYIDNCFEQICKYHKYLRSIYASVELMGLKYMKTIIEYIFKYFILSKSLNMCTVKKFLMFNYIPMCVGMVINV